MTTITESPVTAHAVDHASGHVVPIPVLLGVFVTLIALTGLTVAATHVDLGSWNVHLAMAIATVKGALVVLYFMHLRYDRPFNAVVFAIALLFVGIFLSVTLLDTQQYRENIRRYERANPQAMPAAASAPATSPVPAAKQ